jgi:hypothetical protein
VKLRLCLLLALCNVFDLRVTIKKGSPLFFSRLSLKRPKSGFLFFWLLEQDSNL